MDLRDALGDGNNQSGGGGLWPGQSVNPAWPGQPAANPTWPGAPSGGGGGGAWPGAPSGGGGGGAWPGAPSGGGGGAWPVQPNPPSQPSNPTWPGPSGGGGGAWPVQPNPPSQPQQNLVVVPYSCSLSRGVYDKLLITIVGTIKPNAHKITVDLSVSGGDLAFHFNPRFNEPGGKVIVRNSCLGNKWGCEERSLGRFPFVEGQPFTMKILCTNSEYKVAVNNDHLLEYKHRIRNLRSIDKISIYNDLTLSRVTMETLP